MNEKEQDNVKCKKCFHYEACMAWVRHGMTLYDDYSYSVENCSYFHASTDVVAVIRCKNCKYFGKTIKNGKHACMDFQMQFCTDDDYCSHAVRKVE